MSYPIAVQHTKITRGIQHIYKDASCVYERACRDVVAFHKRCREHPHFAYSTGLRIVQEGCTDAAIMLLNQYLCSFIPILPHRQKIQQALNIFTRFMRLVGARFSGEMIQSANKNAQGLQERISAAMLCGVPLMVCFTLVAVSFPVLSVSMPFHGHGFMLVLQSALLALNVGLHILLSSYEEGMLNQLAQLQMQTKIEQTEFYYRKSSELILSWLLNCLLSGYVRQPHFFYLSAVISLLLLVTIPCVILAAYAFEKEA